MIEWVFGVLISWATIGFIFQLAFSRYVSTVINALENKEEFQKWLTNLQEQKDVDLEILPALKSLALTHSTVAGIIVMIVMWPVFLTTLLAIYGLAKASSRF